MFALIILCAVSSVFTNTLRDLRQPWNRIQQNVNTHVLNSQEQEEYQNNSEGKRHVRNDQILYDMVHNVLRNNENINKLNSVENQCKLTKAIEDLTKILAGAVEVAKQNRGKMFKPLHAVIQRGDNLKRSIRESKDETVIYDLKNDMPEERINVTRKNLTLKEVKENNTTDNNAIHNKENTYEIENTDDIEDTDKTENADTIQISGRRMYTDTNPVVNSQVKETLLRYINEGFQEIETKIASLANLKSMFSNYSIFRIGYLISTLDSLDTNMQNLKGDMKRNKHLWSDQKILNLYDVIRTANNAVSKLLDVLKTSVGAIVI